MGEAESRPGDGLWPSKESAGVEMSRFMHDYFSPSAYLHSSYLSVLYSGSAKGHFWKILISHHVVSTRFEYPECIWEIISFAAAQGWNQAFMSF